MLRVIILLLETAVAFLALRGGIGLLRPDALGIPLSLLQNTPFTSFLLPGLILLFVVGGTHVLAIITLLRNSLYAHEFSVTAGFGLLIWTFVEIYMIPRPHWLQALMFAIGVTVISLTVLRMRLQFSPKEHHQTSTIV